MSYADKVFIEMCRDIIDNGTSTEGEKVRPVWEDAYTIKKFGIVNRYDLSKEFPALTLRRTGIKSCVDEMLWIWQKKSNNIHDLNSHIWDSWADEDGSIGKAYGYQMQVKHQYKEGMMDQVDRVIYDLKNNPYSRRIMTNIYVHQDLHEMNLYPCAYSMTFNVTKEKDSDKLTLNGILNQRSQDVLAANNWNVCQYAVLLHMLAQVCDMKVGEFVHVIADAHIYDRHIPMIEELIKREPLPAPKFWLNPEVKDFYEFTPDDVRLDGYETHPQIKNRGIGVVQKKEEMNMNAIVAADKNWAIGYKNKLLVSIPADMKFFRQMTGGKVVVMGRKTLESFPNGLPLKNRTNIVLTGNPNYHVKDAVIVHTTEELLEELKKYDEEEIFVIGGESIYRMMLPYCSKVYVTKIDHAYQADTYFPNLDQLEDWEMTEVSEEHTCFDLEYVFSTYERRQ